MEVRLKEKFKVEFDAIDCMGEMSVYGISTYMQMIAAHHADKLDFNFFKNGENPGLFWIISKVKYVMNNYPKWDDEIFIETYPGGYDKLCAVRLFDIYSKEDQKMGSIIGNYLLMDAEKMRPVRIKGGQGTLALLDFPYEGEKLQKLKIGEKILKTEYRKAYYSEMDLNGHMNNSHYVKWAVDILPLELLKTHHISSLEINYNTSIQYDMEVELILTQEESGVYQVSGNSKETDKNFFIAEIRLKTR